MTKSLIAVGSAQLSDANPRALGTASSGSESTASRADHVHAMPNRARGAYDAIVYKQDDEVIAEDAEGDEIEDGAAGTDDSTVLNAALVLGGVISTFGSMTLTSTVSIPAHATLDANMPLRISSTGGETPVWTVNCDPGIMCGTTSYGSVGRTIRNLRLKSATALSNTAIDFRRSQYTLVQNVGFADFNKCMNIQCMYTSRMDNIYNYNSNYVLYSQYLAAGDVSDLVLTAFSPCNVWEWGVYLEDNSTKDTYVFGNIAENSTGGFTGNGVHIGPGCRSIHLNDVFLGQSSVTKYALEDLGSFNGLHGCIIYRGQVRLGAYGVCDSGCRFGSGAYLRLYGNHSSLANSVFNDIAGISHPVQVYGDKCSVIGCSFDDSDSKYYIEVKGSDAIISGNRFEGLNSDDNYAVADSYPVYINSATGTVITSNNFNGNPKSQAGIYVPIGSDVVISANAGYT